MKFSKPNPSQPGSLDPQQPESRLSKSPSTPSGRSGQSWIYLAIAAFVALLVGAGLWWYMNQSSQLTSDNEQLTENNLSANEADQPFDEAQGRPFDEAQGGQSTADWQTYRNEEYGIELQYPSTLQLSEYNSNPDYTLAMISLLSLEENPADPTGVPLVRALINRSGEFRVGTRDWEPFQLNEKELSIACNDVLGERGFDCEIAGLFADVDSDFIYYIQTDKDPREDSLTNQILSTFRFIDKTTLSEEQVAAYLENLEGFGYGVESHLGIDITQIEDINNDGRREFYIEASGAGGSCVGGSTYKALYSPANQEYFIGASSLLSSLPFSQEDTFCRIDNEDAVWEACPRGDYMEYTCFSNNLQKEENAAFKAYLDNVLD